jgi:hypothetical protein
MVVGMVIMLLAPTVDQVDLAVVDRVGEVRAELVRVDRVIMVVALVTMVPVAVAVQAQLGLPDLVIMAVTAVLA